MTDRPFSDRFIERALLSPAEVSLAISNREGLSVMWADRSRTTLEDASMNLCIPLAVQGFKIYYCELHDLLFFLLLPLHQFKTIFQIDASCF